MYNCFVFLKTYSEEGIRNGHVNYSSTLVEEGGRGLFPLRARLHLIEMSCNKLQQCYQKGVCALG